MADFEYPITAGTAPNSFTIADTGVTGIAATAVVPVVVRLAPALVLLHTGTQTQATIATAMLRYLRARGYGRESAGGVKVAPTDGQVAPTLTEVAAAD